MVHFRPAKVAHFDPFWVVHFNPARVVYFDRFLQTDDNGNISTCTTVVTVEDTVAPTAMCAAPFTIQLDANGDASITAADIDNGSTDACGIASTTIDVTSFDCTNVGDNTVTLTVTDNNGNMSTCTTVVTVEDTVAPTAMCAAPFTVQLDANGDASITAADIDNGSTDACGIASTTIDVTSFDCTNVGANTVTLTVTDDNGNMSTCTTVVTVEDTVAPIAMCAAPFTVQLDAMGMATITVTDIDNGSTDACGIASTTIDVTSFDSTNVGDNTVTLTVIDTNGNVSTCATIVTVEDNVAPMAMCAAPFTVQLDANGDASITVADIDNGSTDASGIVSTTIDVTSFDCTNVGDNTVTLTVTDTNGNVSTCATTVTVEDTIPVIVISGPLDIFTGTGATAGDCSAIVNYDPVTIDDFVLENNCGDNASITITQTGGLGAGAAFPLGETVEEYTLTDVNGNETIYAFTVTITDTTLPVVDCPSSDVIVAGNDNGEYIIEDYTGLASDNCSSGGELVVTQEPTAGTLVTDPSTTAVTLTATDAAGNSIICTFDVVVDETLSIESAISFENALQLYPNPASDVITIAATNEILTKVAIYDIRGRLVITSAVNASEKTLDVSNIVVGVYLVQVSSNDKIATKRFIKK